MSFIKRNFHDILRLYINQVGITIFALMLYTACGVVDNDLLLAKLRTVISVFSILFFFVLLYYVAWEYGAKDLIRVDGGKIERSSAKGLLMALIANIPNLLLSVATCIFGFLYVGGNQALGNFFGLFQAITMAHASMYMGLIQTIVYGFTAVDAVAIDYRYLIMPILFVVIPLLSVAVVHFAYTLGYKEIKIVKVLFDRKK